MEVALAAGLTVVSKNLLTREALEALNNKWLLLFGDQPCHHCHALSRYRVVLTTPFPCVRTGRPGSIDDMFLECD